MPECVHSFLNHFLLVVFLYSWHFEIKFNTKLNKRLDRPDDLKAKEAIRTRLQGHSKNLIPKRGTIPQDQQVTLFRKEA